MQTLEEGIFWEVYRSQMCLRHDLVEHLSVSLPSVSRLVESLLKHQLIVETRSKITKRGRKPHFLQINPKLAMLLGVEIERNAVTAVVTDLAGGLLGRGSVQCEAGQGLELVVKSGMMAVKKLWRTLASCSSRSVMSDLDIRGSSTSRADPVSSGMECRAGEMSR